MSQPNSDYDILVKLARSGCKEWSAHYGSLLYVLSEFTHAISSMSCRNATQKILRDRKFWKSLPVHRLFSID